MPIFIELTSEAMGYNRSYLTSIFKKETDCALSQYILNKKIETAKRMIASDIPLSEISAALGFCSQSHFCQRFRHAAGITPKEFRESPGYTRTVLP